jgi:hypothetical protein
MTDVPEIITTTVSSLHRTISLGHEDGAVVRYALVRDRHGDVFWRHDVFDAAKGMRWVAHGGRVTVGQVLSSAPQCARDVRRWTEQEIEEGPDAADVDVLARASRAEALQRLAQELAAALVPSEPCPPTTTATPPARPSSVC